MSPGFPVVRFNQIFRQLLIAFDLLPGRTAEVIGFPKAGPPGAYQYDVTLPSILDALALQRGLVVRHCNRVALL